MVIRKRQPLNTSCRYCERTLMKNIKDGNHFVSCKCGAVFNFDVRFDAIVEKTIIEPGKKVG